MKKLLSTLLIGLLVTIVFQCCGGLSAMATEQHRCCPQQAAEISHNHHLDFENNQTTHDCGCCVSEASPHSETFLATGNEEPVADVISSVSQSISHLLVFNTSYTSAQSLLSHQKQANERFRYLRLARLLN